MSLLSRCYYSLISVIMILDAIAAKTKNCKSIQNKCRRSDQCCDELTCIGRRCCKNLGEKCKNDEECCSKNCDDKICSCPKRNKNLELDNKGIRKAIRKNYNSDIEYWNVKKVTDMSNLFFHRRYRQFNRNLECWDVSNVTDMHRMYYDARYFNQNLNKWDVSKVENMGGCSLMQPHLMAM